MAMFGFGRQNASGTDLFAASADADTPRVPASRGGFISGLADAWGKQLDDRQAAAALAPYLDSVYGAESGAPQTGGFLSQLLGFGQGAAPSVSPAAAAPTSAPSAAPQRGLTASEINSAPPAGAPLSGVPPLPGSTPSLPSGVGAAPTMPAAAIAPRLPRAAVERLLANPETRRLGLMLIPGGELDRLRDSDAWDRSFSERKFVADQDYRRQSLDIQRQAGARASARLDDNAPRTTTIYDPETGQPQTAQWDAGAGDWKPIGGTKQAPPRPVPAAMQKAEAEDLQDVQTIGQLNSQLSGYVDQIDSGKLVLGPVQNRVAELQNYVGNSDENSRNYASFVAGMEKMRNESLRLNKGVQTEGDAQRAWNEVLANINDPAVVKQRLQEIQRYNATAAEFKKNQIGLRRATSNLPELDVGSVVTAPATGAPKSGASASPREGQTATNPQTGERIIFRNGQWGRL